MSDGIGYRHSDATYYLVHDEEPDLRSLAGHAHRRVKIRGRALEVSAMTAWKRWHEPDLAPICLDACDFGD